jgi:transposase
VIEACCEPGASVAGIAMANGVNANQVRRWMRERGIEPPTRRVPMPVLEAAGDGTGLRAVADCPGTGIGRYPDRNPAGNTAIKVDWPVQASGDCAAWLRDWLR